MDFARFTKQDLIDVVRKKFRTTRIEAINKIHEDLELFGTVELAVEPPPIFDAVKGDMDYRFWDSFKIPRSIVDLYAFQARTVYRNEDYWGRSTSGNPIYVYPFPSGRMKFYRPKSPDPSKKWAGNSTAEDVGGISQLPKKGKLLVITSSIKDVMVFRQHGIPAICFNGEGYGCDKMSESYEVVKNTLRGLRKRFTHMVLFFDSDRVGRVNSARFSELHKVPYTFVLKRKDPSDFQKAYGCVVTFRTIKKALSKALRDEI
jgi:hypothetical protein